MNEDGLTPLVYAINENYLEGVRILLENKADPNLKLDNGMAPINFAGEINSI